LADSERGCRLITERERALTAGTGLELVGRIARLLNAGREDDETLAGVAESLHTGLGVAQAAIWFRDTQTGCFRVIACPSASAPPLLVDSLEAIPDGGPGVRLPLEHDDLCVGLLEVRPEPEPAARASLIVVADLLAAFLASLALSADFAVEVASQSREIDEQRRFTGLIIDSLPIGLYVVDRDYRIQIWNRQREIGAPGLRRDEVVGRLVFEVLTRQPADELRAEFDRVFQTGEIQQAELEVSLGGEARSFRLSKIPMRLEGDTISHVITIGEDVTESRRTQGQIMQSEKLAAIGQLAAGVMHEINNPLATISACVAAISGRLGTLAPREKTAVEEYLEIIDKEVDRCTRIVDGLLDFSRPKGKTKGRVVLNALVDETLFLLKHHQRFKRLTVTRELDPSLPTTTGNAEQLTQVLMALMLNAVDAMDDRGKLTVRTGRSAVHSDEVMLEIEDNGIGIPRADQSKIFEPFYTTKPPGRGTGLGLSICYGIVEEHRGRIEVDSQPGRGSIFRVFLPSHTSEP
jgi:two-component system, NtrC family, sensor kinase